MPVFLRLLPPALLALACAHAGAQLTDIATTPLGTYTPASSNAAKPNIFMVIDDSGSMAWNYMPDNADSQISYQQSNTNYNGIAYNPALVYTPPVKVDSNGNVTSYPSMNGSSTANGATSGWWCSTQRWLWRAEHQNYVADAQCLRGTGVLFVHAW